MSIGIFFDIKNYANILDGHLIHSRVDYMGSGIGKKVIYGNTIKIDAIIGHETFPPTAARHKQHITPPNTIQYLQNTNKQILGHKKLIAVCHNIFYGIFILCKMVLYKIIFLHLFIKHLNVYLKKYLMVYWFIYYSLFMVIFGEIHSGRWIMYCNTWLAQKYICTDKNRNKRRC
eukprot:93070_1